MRIAIVLTAALFGIQTVIAEEATVEDLTRKVETLEQQVADLRGQLAALGGEEDLHLSTAAERSGRAHILLYVLVDGRIQVNGKIMNDADVTERLKAVEAQYPGQPLIIRGDLQAKYQDIFRVIDLCQKSGIWNISFGTIQPKGESGRNGD